MRANYYCYQQWAKLLICKTTLPRYNKKGSTIYVLPFLFKEITGY